MKKLLIILMLTFYFCSPCHAGMLIGSGVDSGASCSGDYGYTTEALTVLNFQAGYITLVRIPLDCAGTVGEIAAWLYGTRATDRLVEFGLYADNGSGTEAALLLGNYGEYYDPLGASTKVLTSDTTIGEIIAGSPSFIWAAVMTQSDTTRIYYDAGTGHSRVYVGTWGVWPGDWADVAASDTAYTDRDYSLYLKFP